MPFFRRFFGTQQPERPAELVDATVFGGRERMVEVVGEANYQDALAVRTEEDLWR
jgi:hypothetical protein